MAHFQHEKFVQRWHGYRQGVGLYFHHRDSPLSEHSEIGLTTEMTLAASLIMRQTHLLGSPYIDCSNDPNAASCIKKDSVLYYRYLLAHSSVFRTEIKGNRTADFRRMRVQLWYSYAT